MSSTALMLKREYFNYLGQINCTDAEENYTILKSDCACSYLYPPESDPNRIVNLASF